MTESPTQSGTAPRTGLVEWLSQRLEDPRDPQRVIHPISELLRDSVAVIAQGWDDQKDADTLRDDPLLAACAETGDLLGALLRPGNAGPAIEAAPRPSYARTTASGARPRPTLVN